MSAVKMEEGVDFVDLARALIQPGPNGYPWSQSTSHWGLTDHSSTPGPTATSSNAVNGVVGSNESYFTQNSGLASAHRAGLVTNTVTSAPSPTPSNDRAAQLRAQLLATRKMTPDTTKAGPTSEQITSQNTPGIFNEQYARASAKLHASGDADVDDLLASISAATPSRNPAQLNGSSATHDNTGRQHNEPEDNKSGGHSNSNGQDPSTRQRERPGSSQQNARWRGTDQSLSEPRESLNSNGVGGSERSRAEQDRTEREKAAAAYKAKMTASLPRYNSGDKIKTAESTRQEPVEPLGENKPLVPQARPRIVAEVGKSTTRTSLKDFDVATVPIEVAQWLELHRFWDESHRTKVLNRENKRLELERQLRELDEEELEDGVRITRGPVALHTPVTASETPRPAGQTVEDPEKNKVEIGPSTPSVQKPDKSTKRTREEDLATTEPKAKAIKTEPRPLESRITRDIVPERPRTRESPAPRSRNGYESWHPPPSRERDRYDSYQGPAYGAHYSERERDRDLEERERYSRLAFEEEEKERAKKAQKKKSWSGIPCVPCRYYQQGSCHRGSTCTFLHE